MEPINKIKCMDDDLSSLLAGFASKMQAETLALEEEEKSENLGGDGDKAVASSSSSEYNKLYAYYFSSILIETWSKTLSLCNRHETNRGTDR